MVTVAALIGAGQPEQITFHLPHALANGLSREEAGAMLSRLAFCAGWPKVFLALPVAKAVFDNRANCQRRFESACEGYGSRRPVGQGLVA